MTFTRKTLIGSAILMAVGAGCASDTGYSDNFFKGSEKRPVREVLEKQAIAGAREDATLQAAHFDGTALNSLGERKLMLMADGPVDRDIVVYLDFPANSDLTAGRREAVTAYLTAGGYAASHVKLQDGANPNLSTPAAGGLSRYAKTESEGLMNGASAAGEVPMK